MQVHINLNADWNYAINSLSLGGILKQTYNYECFSPVHATDLVVQCQERHWGVYCLAALSTKPHHLSDTEEL